MVKGRTQGKLPKLPRSRGEARVDEAQTGANRPMTARNMRRLAAKQINRRVK
jgi:hypothetical protein